MTRLVFPGLKKSDSQNEHIQKRNPSKNTSTSHQDNSRQTLEQKPLTVEEKYDELKKDLQRKTQATRVKLLAKTSSTKQQQRKPRMPQQQAHRLGPHRKLIKIQGEQKKIINRRKWQQ